MKCSRCAAMTRREVGNTVRSWYIACIAPMSGGWESLTNIATCPPASQKSVATCSASATDPVTCTA